MLFDAGLNLFLFSPHHFHSNQIHFNSLLRPLSIQTPKAKVSTLTNSSAEQFNAAERKIRTRRKITPPAFSRYYAKRFPKANSIKCAGRFPPNTTRFSEKDLLKNQLATQLIKNRNRGFNRKIRRTEKSVKFAKTNFTLFLWGRRPNARM